MKADPSKRFILGSIILFATLPVFANPLLKYEWQNRPLLLFAPDNEDKHLVQLLATLQKSNCDIDDRDMIIAVLLAEGQSRLNNNNISAQDAALIRKRYEIEPSQFAVLLIGKDGGEKYRLFAVPELNEIFSLIDGMPMRQDEMQENLKDCH
jgi:hypothetical protein